MKIAVSNSNGVQTQRDLKLQKYDLVEDDYVLDNSQFVTNPENMILLFSRFEDYKEFRSSLQVWAADQTFSDLSQSDKEILALNFAVDISDILTVYPSLEKILENGKAWHLNSVEARTKRRNDLETEMNFGLTEDDKNDLIDTPGISELLDKYVNLGREGVDNDGPGLNGLIDFLLSKNDYVGSGFLDKPYTPTNGETKSVLAARIVRIITKGRSVPKVPLI